MNDTRYDYECIEHGPNTLTFDFDLFVFILFGWGFFIIRRILLYKHLDIGGCKANFVFDDVRRMSLLVLFRLWI